jgi:hypothetical protein
LKRRGGPAAFAAAARSATPAFPAAAAAPLLRAVGVGRCRGAGQTRARSRCPSLQTAPACLRPPPPLSVRAPGPARLLPPALRRLRGPARSARPRRSRSAPGVGSRCGKQRDGAADPPPPRIAAATRVRGRPPRRRNPLRRCRGPRPAWALLLTGLMCQPAVAGTDSTAGRRGLVWRPAQAGEPASTGSCAERACVPTRARVPAGTGSCAGSCASRQWPARTRLPARARVPAGTGSFAGGQLGIVSQPALNRVPAGHPNVFVRWPGCPQ